jgi:hypothetical protein
MKIRILTSLAIVALAASASAQDISADATYSTFALESGFMPDPHDIALAAGGGTEVTQAGCAGFVADAPDAELTFTAGELPLNIYVTSEGDTTLVINAPDGSWHCNDDSNGFNPAVSFNPAISGVYDIWVGTYDSGSLPPAVLHITELDPQW